MFLCLLHLFSRRPLWLDEASLLDNLKNLSGHELFGVLRNCQAFPRAYLFAVKSVSGVFDYNPLALRSLPFLCMLAAFFLWMRVFTLAFAGIKERLLALFSFTSSYYFIYYAAEFKQYSMDLLAAGVFSLLILRQKKAAFLFLPILLFFSYAAFFFLWIPAYMLLAAYLKERKGLGLLLGYAALSAAAGLLVYRFDLRFNLDQGCLFGYWKDYFICTDSAYCFMKSFTEGLRKLSTWPFGNAKLFIKLGSVFMPFFLLGLYLSARKLFREAASGKFSLEALGFLLWCELFFFGVLKIYPFTGERITLFFMPFVFMLIINGIGGLRRFKMPCIIFTSAYFLFLVFCAVDSLLKYLRPYL